MNAETQVSKAAGRTTAQKKNAPVPLPFQTPGEEVANSVIHGIGALLAVAALVIMVFRGRDAWEIVSYTIFGTSMILLFLASTLYHAISHEKAKQVFRIFDHSAIYLLIAGTYTPFCLIPLRGPWGWTLFGIEWGLAIIGITLYSLGIKALKKIELAVYILMGWAVVIGWMPLVKSIPRTSLYLLMAGGLCYTAGTFWYRQKVKRGTHVTWHVFVFAGAFAHFWAIWTLS
ncbi:MAG: hemolysin III family protein [Treponemataceae bacterium]